MKNKLSLLCFLVPLTVQIITGQSGQRIYGVVKEKDTSLPLMGAIIEVNIDSTKILGSATDEYGTYSIDNIPLGRQLVTVSYVGYKSISNSNIIFTAGKQVNLDVEMDAEIMELGQVVVTSRKSGEVQNEMGVVSGREFSMDETNRYAGSRGDPPRMAANFAGVQGADDSRNDIIIRGNTPQGVIWRLEGINIPNPNHFAIPGTGGGPVTILNNKFLANSDFYTGAFPAEFGNGISGVFDLEMRNGNSQQHEFSGQVGFLGTELLAEGPLSKKGKASYLAMYRYSTLKLFQFLGIEIGTDAVPSYQDGAFRLQLPGRNGSVFSVFGIGGISDIQFRISEQERPDESTLIYGQNDRDQHFASQLGIIGTSFTTPIKSIGFFKTIISASHANVDSDHNYIYRHTDMQGDYVVDSLPPILNYTFRENKYSIHSLVNLKLKKGSVRAGVITDLMSLAYIDSVRTIVVMENGNSLAPWKMRWNAKDEAVLIQPYVHWRRQVSPALAVTAGITALYFSGNKNSFSPFEPRVGFEYKLSPIQTITFGAGLHSQIQTLYEYYYRPAEIDAADEYNLALGLTKSIHTVLGYNTTISSDIRVKVETYYQHLYNIPVDIKLSSFSLINAGSGFERVLPQELINEGVGRNFGLELTLEKSFSHQYAFLFTGSVYSSKYKGSDDIWRNTTFNGRYAFNALFTKEFVTKKENVFSIGTKITYAGGRWYGPVDREASASELEIVYEDATVNTQQFRPYFRTDIKFNYRINADRVTHEFGLDLVNLLNTRNILTLTYSPDSPDGEPVREEYQLGFLPLFYYKIDF